MLFRSPGVQVRPFSPRSEIHANDLHGESRRHLTPDNPAEQIPAPQIIRLQSGAAPSTSQEMSQQAKIAAALTRAGITKPEAWSAAGVPYQAATVEENTPPATLAAHSEMHLHEVCLHEARANEDRSSSSGFNLTPPVVLMKGANDSTFVISFRSQKEFGSALAWKSAAMVCGGAALTVLGVYMLLAQMKLF